MLARFVVYKRHRFEFPGCGGMFAPPEVDARPRRAFGFARQKNDAFGFNGLGRAVTAPAAKAVLIYPTFLPIFL